MDLAQQADSVQPDLSAQQQQVYLDQQAAPSPTSACQLSTTMRSDPPAQHSTSADHQITSSAQPTSNNPSSLPSTSQHSMVTRSRDNSRHIRQFPDYVALNTDILSEPTSFTQANLMHTLNGAKPWLLSSLLLLKTTPGLLSRHLLIIVS